MGVIIFLLVVWLVLAILGLVIEGLFWLTVIGLILLVGTAIWGWMKRNTGIAS
jgi:LPXTG-motif cell wall-anchored protein